MCGIIGIFGKSEDMKGEINDSLQKIEHRGTYLYETKIFGDAGLGVNRLAIVDEYGGKQPISNEDETIFAVQNGEIFNYKELKKSLEDKGHKFKTNCDTEILVHLFEEYKDKMINMIDSEMFAFIIYNKITNEVFVARDIIGVKPLCYAHDNLGRIFFSSEIKQLSNKEGIKNIYEFPAGNYFFNGKFTKYFDFTAKIRYNKQILKSKIKVIIENAVKKRVQTNQPIGVFLSGGVDSSLIMELATRYHNDVTAIILGYSDSPDYINAIRLCKEKKWRYVVVNPDINYEEEIENMIYYLESYEPNIVRHSFANELVSKKAKELGLKIVLVGEGSDELFAGYNEFAQIPERKINIGCKMLLEAMSNGHCMRVDKLAMKHTIEIRSPFYDTSLIKLALSIPGHLKIKKNKGLIITKAILREIACDYLPSYIAYRYKAPFANGAGMNIGYNFNSSDGILSKIANKNIDDNMFNSTIKSYSKYNFKTKEEVMNFLIYKNFNYYKFKNGEKRIIIKDNLKDIAKTKRDIKTEKTISEFLETLFKDKYIDKKAIKRVNYLELTNQVSKLISENKKINIVGYWGVEKEKYDKNEVIALLNLVKLKANLKKSYSKTEVTLVLTDLHGKINKLPDNMINDYYKDIARLASKYKIKSIYLSKLYKNQGLPFNKILRKIPTNLKSKFLINSSKKHYLGKNKSEGAKIYELFSYYDSKVIEREFNDSIFFTYNSSDWVELLPSIPILFIWPLKKGFHDKPWHLEYQKP